MCVGQAGSGAGREIKNTGPVVNNSGLIFFRPIKTHPYPENRDPPLSFFEREGKGHLRWSGVS